MNSLLTFIDPNYDAAPTTELLSEIYESDCDMVIAAQNRVIAEHYSQMYGEPEIMMEGFTEFAEKASEWFKKLGKAIIKFFKQFISVFTDWSLDLQAFCKKHRDELTSLSKFEATIQGYNFTVLNHAKPNMSSFDDIVTSYNSLLADIEDEKDTDIVKKSKAFLSDENLDRIRGEVLGVKEHIPADKYREYVRKEYRGGEEEVTELKFDEGHIREIVNHAGELVEAKKKAIEDRDRIISLLNKAETFFGDKLITSYNDNMKQIRGQSLDTNSGAKSVKRGEVTTFGYDKNIKAYNALMNTKYAETKAVAAIINIVVTERANAFRDQVKQERKLVSMAMKPKFDMGSSESKTESTELLLVDAPVDDDEFATDYVQSAYEMMIDDGPVVETTCLHNMCAEATWMDQMIMNGESSVVMEGFFANIKQALVNFFHKIVGLFKDKGQVLANKYAPWLADDGVIDEIKANAPKASFNLLDYWSVDPDAQMNDLKSLVTKAMEEPKSPDTCDLAKDYLGETNIAKIRDFKKNGRDMTNILKNYFISGKPGVDKLETVTLAGSQLTGKIDDIVKYVVNYDKFTEKMVDLDAAAKNLKVQESTDFNLDTYLMIENRRVIDSDLAILLEAGAPAGGVNNPKPGTGNAAANKANANARNTTQNATQVTANNTDKNATGETGEPEETNDAANKEYFNFTVDFVKKAVSAYLSVCENRLITYVNLLKALTGPEHKPVFNNNKYVPIKDRQAKTQEDTGVEDNNAEGNTGNKKGGRLSRAKAKVGNALSRAGAKLTRESMDVSEEDLQAIYDKPTRGIDWMN